MYETLFILLALLYTIVSVKIDYWTTISELGFKSETPELFLSRPIYYNIVRSVLFLGAIATIFIAEFSPWFFGVAIMMFLWISAGWRGRKKAFAMYRSIIEEMLKEAETEEEKAEYTKAMQKSDQELMDEILKT